MRRREKKNKTKKTQAEVRISKCKNLGVKLALMRRREYLPHVVITLLIFKQMFTGDELVFDVH